MTGARRLLKALPDRLSYANVVATLALFVALGGASYAAVALPRDSVGSAQLKRNAVTAKKIRNGAVTGPKLKAGTITAKRIRRGTITRRQLNLKRLGSLPNAAKLGGLGPQAFARANATAPDAAALGGTPANRYFRVGGTLPRGATISGSFGGLVNAALRYDAVVSFPVPSPTAVATENIRFAPGTVSAPADRIDPGCSGTLFEPVAPAGLVCLYVGQIGVDTEAITALVAGQDGRRGFTVRTMGAPDLPGFQGAFGTWVYTVP
ncbi:MAG TPA: hypothetical protein VI111_06945 [Thermoleophilaceae bacterium]